MSNEHNNPPVACGNGCDCLAQCGDTYAHAGLPKPPAPAVPQGFEPAGYLLHWPSFGGSRKVIWNESRVSGDAIGCPVTQVFKQSAATPAPAPAVPQGWTFSVSDDDDGTWLRVKSPGGREAAFSAVNGGLAHDNRRSIASRVLLELKEALAATPAPAPAQEPVDMVPRAALHEVERERDWYKARSQTMHAHQNGQVWYWQGDGEDHPETLVNSLPVVIRADQLRELIAKPAQEVTQSEPIYQLQRGDGSWIDQDKASYDYNAQYGINTIRIVYTAPAPAQEVGLADDERVRCLIASGCIGTVKMTYDSGPYEITRTSINASRLIDAIIAALRAKGGK